MVFQVSNVFGTVGIILLGFVQFSMEVNQWLLVALVVFDAVFYVHNLGGILQDLFCLSGIKVYDRGNFFIARHVGCFSRGAS